MTVALHPPARHAFVRCPTSNPLPGSPWPSRLLPSSMPSPRGCYASDPPTLCLLPCIPMPAALSPLPSEACPSPSYPASVCEVPYSRLHGSPPACRRPAAATLPTANPVPAAPSSRHPAALQPKTHRLNYHGTYACCRCKRRKLIQELKASKAQNS